MTLLDRRVWRTGVDDWELDESEPPEEALFIDFRDDTSEWDVLADLLDAGWGDA